MRVLIVEDAQDVAEAVAASLEKAGFACDLTASLSEARDFCAVQSYDVIVLDINLPDGDGRTLLRGLRRAGNATPVLMLTAEFDVSSRVDALDRGADDYLVKPFDLRELQARLRVLVRRDKGLADNRIHVGDLAFDPSAQIVRRDGEVLAMTRREMALLHLFLTHRGQILPKERLLDGLFSLDSDVGINTVELYVARLRKKLAGSAVTIETHRGLGYRLHAPDG